MMGILPHLDPFAYLKVFQKSENLHPKTLASLQLFNFCCLPFFTIEFTSVTLNLSEKLEVKVVSLNKFITTL